MAQQDSKRGPDTVNLGRKQGGMVGSADQRIDPENRSPDEMKYEVAQRGSQTASPEKHEKHEKHEKEETPPRVTTPAGSGSAAPDGKQTSGYGNREDRENPAAGLPQKDSGEKQSPVQPGEGMRVSDSHAMSQNGAAIRPSR